MGLFGSRKDSIMPERTDYSQTWASVTMNEDDLIRFIQFSKEEIEQIRVAILTSWPNGIQNERDYHGSWEFKLRGNPWVAQGSEAVTSRMLVRGVLAHLYHMGWQIAISSDISKKAGDKDTLLFRRHGPAPDIELVAVSFNEDDKLRLIGAPGDLPQAIRQTLGPAIQSEKDKDGATQFKLNGNPWISEGSETVTTRAMLLNILQTLETHGFRMYASVNQSSKETEEMDTWYLCRPVGWAPGRVVYSELFPAPAAPYGAPQGGYAPAPGGYPGPPPPGPGYPGSPPPPAGYPGSPPPPGGYYQQPPQGYPQAQAPYGGPPPPGAPYGGAPGWPQ
ncbi:hypothetical protein HWV62_267 [Athelia sp. TMB]|nr:hypothetical protein HWV62_267 [Athelia sp. TMB]